MTVTLDGHEITLAPEDVQVGTEQAPGWVSGDDRGIQLALSTALTPELLREGMARDFIRQVQQLRKDANLEIENRIRICFASDDEEVLTMIAEWSDLIRGETLAVSLVSGDVPADAKTVNIGDVKVLIGIEKV